MRRTESGVLVMLGSIALCLFAVLSMFFLYELGAKRGLWARAAGLYSLTPTKVAGNGSPSARLSAATMLSTRSPQPTNTLVIPREAINEPLLREIETKMASIRGLTLRQPVPRKFLTQDGLRQRLAELQTQNDQRQVAFWQALYVQLGFLAPDDDLNALLDELSVRSMAGYYSPDDRQLYIVSERYNMTAAEEMAFAHEFTHALQDQYYHLKYLDERAKTLDAHLAVMALIEGDATLAMAQYAIGHLSQTDVDELAYRAARLTPDEVKDIPPALTKITLFPYEAGLQFVLALFKQRGWDAVNAAYGVPPVSTEQIMHFEKYFPQPDPPQPVAMPDMGELVAGSWHEIDRGTLGEFLLGVHLESGLSEEEALAAVLGWGGDTYSLLEDAQGRFMLALRSVWDAPAAADRFYRAYVKMMAARGAGKILDEANRSRWHLFDREVYVSAQGKDALIIIAPETGELERAVKWFPGY